MNKNQKQKNIILLLCLIAFEYAIFSYTATTYITPFYPRYFDQIQYLRESYLAFEEMRNSGILSAIYSTLKKEVAQGVWHDFASLISMRIFGPHRYSALLVNFIWLIFFQLALFIQTLSSTKKFSSAWLSTLMPLMTQGIWLPYVGGALYDFRLDHLAMCMMGLTIITCLKTQGFTNRKWAIVFGLMVSLTITGRFLTSVYFLLIYCLLLLYLLTESEKISRVKNLFFSGVIASPLVIIFFFHNWGRIYSYYLVGHLYGIEKSVRSSGLNIIETFLYITQNGIYQFQGALFFLICLVVYCSYLYVVNESEDKLVPKIIPPVFSWWIVVGGIFFMSPVIALTFESETQNAVLSIISPGIITLSLGILIPCLMHIQSVKPNLARTILISATFLSLANFSYKNLHFPNFSKYAVEANKVNQISDYIFQYSNESHLHRKLSTNRIVEFLDANIQKVVIYERHGKWLPIEGLLPASLLEIPTIQIYERLKNSDLVFFIEYPKIARGFPAEIQMQNLNDDLIKILQRQFILISSIEVFGNNVKIFRKIE